MYCFASHITVWCHKSQFWAHLQFHCESVRRGLTDALLSLFLCQICSFISRLFTFSRILMKLFHITSIYLMAWLSDALFLSLQYQVPVYWSYFDLRRGEDKWQTKKKDECDVLFSALHFAFSLFFSENVFVNSRSDFNLQIQLKPFELLMVASDLNLSVCISFIILMLIVFIWVFFLIKVKMCHTDMHSKLGFHALTDAIQTCIKVLCLPWCFMCV